MSHTARIPFPKLPPLQNVYSGNFRDTSPEVPPAGILTSYGQHVPECLVYPPRPPSPDVIRKFRDTYWPDAGKRRVFYGQASDPERTTALKMRHGICVKSELGAADLINPPPVSNFRHKMRNLRESFYASNVKRPLGHPPDANKRLPKSLDPSTFTFGMPTVMDVEAGILINPRKTYAEAVHEDKEAHDLYIKSHMDYIVGEQRKRGYTSHNFSPNKRFGLPTPHFNDGRKTQESLKWIWDTEEERAARIVSKRVEDFKERMDHALGKVRDPIKDSMHLPPDHVFGILQKPDDYGAGDLIHNRPPGSFMRSYEQVRGTVSACRHHLKKINFHCFDNILQAFKYYDKDDAGSISMENLRDVCRRFGLPVDDEVMVRLMDMCDHDGDGRINYMEFANFLNWKDKMPSGFKPFPVDHTDNANEQQREPDVVEQRLVREGDLVPKDPHDISSVPRRIAKSVDNLSADPRTSYSVYGSAPADHDGLYYRTYGTPTVRCDKPVPRIRRLDDTVNYGDEGGAFSIIQPHKYAHRGLSEKDFLLPRTKEELKTIFANIGVLLTGDTLDIVYDTAARVHPKGTVSVEGFRAVLDDIHADRLIKNEHEYTIRQAE